MTDKNPLLWSVGPLRVGSFGGPDRSRLLVVKGTFALTPGTLALEHSAPQPICAADLLEAGRVIRPRDVIGTAEPAVVHVTGHFNGLNRYGGVARVRVTACGAELEAEVREGALGETVRLRAELAKLSLGSPLSIEGLTSNTRYFASRLPAIAPSALLVRRRIPLTPKLFWIDTDQLVATLTWTGWLGPLEHGDIQVELEDSSPESDVRADQHTMEIQLERAENLLHNERTALPFHGQPSPFPSQPGPPPPPPLAPSLATSQPLQYPSTDAIPRRVPTFAGAVASPVVQPVQMAASPYQQETSASRLPTYLLDAPQEPARIPLARVAAPEGAAASSDAALSAQPAPAQSTTAEESGEEIPVRVIGPVPAEINEICLWPLWVPFAPPKPAPVEPAKPKRGQPPEPPPPIDLESDDRQKRSHLLNILQTAPASSSTREASRAPSVGPATPLLLIEGMLRLPFQDLEELRATAELLDALNVQDKKLKELVDYAKELLKLPLAGSPQFVRQIIVQLEETWAKTMRSFPTAFVSNNVRRQLLEKRAYAKREVFGGSHLRGYLELAGGDVPIYLSDSLSKDLPLVSRFRVRVIAEVHPIQDHQESCGHALRSLVAARVVSESTPADQTP